MMIQIYIGKFLHWKLNFIIMTLIVHIMNRYCETKIYTSIPNIKMFFTLQHKPGSHKRKNTSTKQPTGKKRLKTPEP